MGTVVEFAKELAQAGYSVVPCWGSRAKGQKQKAPCFYELDLERYPCAEEKDRWEWSRLQASPLSAEDIDRYFKPTDWLGIICGTKSGNLECIDFDNKFGDIEEVWKEYISIPEVEKIVLKHKLYIEKTYSGGRHLVYRCENPVGAKRDLAFRLNDKEKPICIIETRSEGQYFVSAPSNGYDVKYGSLQNLPAITSSERDILIDFACSFNEYVKKDKIYATSIGFQKKPSLQSNGSVMKPGNIYNNDPASIEDAKQMLLAEGWKQVSTYGWCRPDKTDGGISATFNKVFPGGFYVFSSNAYPFEQGCTYTPYTILTLLYFDGDFSQSAKALVEKGYFDPNFKAKNVDGDQTQGNYKEAAKMCFDILKRLDVDSEYTESDIAIISSSSGLSKEKSETLLKKIIEENPFLRGHDLLGSEIKKVKAWIRNEFIARNNIIKDDITIIRRKDNSNNPVPVNTDTVYIEAKQNRYRVSRSDIEAIFNTDFVPEYNELHEYFESLPMYKESDPDYIEKFGSYFRCYNPSHQNFWQTMLKKHLVRHIKCALDGIENRTCVVLIGGQESGKSSYIRYLEPKENYYIDSDPVKIIHRDAQIAQCEYLIWNIEELENYNANQLSQIKGMMSRPNDKIRGFHEKKAKNRWRICSFWATTNKATFLTDDTGNSRFLCFMGGLSSFDYHNYETGVVNVPKDRIWAQAYHLYKQGYACNLTDAEKAMRDEINDDFESMNNVDSLIAMHFKPSKDESEYNFWPNAKIQVFLQKVAPRMNDLTPNKISAAFDKIARKNEQLQFARGKKNGMRGVYLECISQESFSQTESIF